MHLCVNTRYPSFRQLFYFDSRYKTLFDYFIITEYNPNFWAHNLVKYVFKVTIPICTIIEGLSGTMNTCSNIDGTMFQTHFCSQLVLIHISREIQDMHLHSSFSFVTTFNEMYPPMRFPVHCQVLQNLFSWIGSQNVKSKTDEPRVYNPSGQKNLRQKSETQ